MEITVLQGQELKPFLDEVSHLRTHIFREWPYFYEGAIQTEKDYLKVYANTQTSILVLAKDHNKIVGVAMGLPAHQSMKEIQKVFHEKKETKESMDSCYYLADTLLLKEHRNQGIGLKMIQKFEEAAASLKKYHWIYLCEVVREKNDPRAPDDYQPLDRFWNRLDYKIVPDWIAYMHWRDIGDDQKSSHPMRFRKKNLLPP